MNNGWWEIDIQGCYSLVKIAFAPISACKNNRRIWRHNARASRSRDITGQLWWRHNVKSEKTVPCDNGEISDRWLFVTERCVQDIKYRVRNIIIHSLPWRTISWSLVRWFANDFHSWLRHSWKALANHSVIIHWGQVLNEIPYKRLCAISLYLSTSSVIDALCNNKVIMCPFSVIWKFYLKSLHL